VAERSVLLHFWPFVVPIYVPAVIGRDGNHHFVGYALAVPDIIDLEGFVRDWPTVARERGTEPAGYRPRDAVIALASEAALDLGRRVLAVTARQGGDAEVRPWLGAVDVVHVEKEGHHVRVRSLRRVDLHRDRVAAYARVREACWTTAFRRQQVSNILEGRPWWGGAGRLCTITAAARTIGDVRFRHDARIAGTEIETEIKMTDTASGGAQTLDHVIYQAARAYVLGRLRSKYGLSWDPALAGNPVWRSEYEAKRERVAREAFLAVRARTGVAFVGYFATMIGSVPQRLGERAFLEVARALRDDQEIERVRSLTLLALSASA
jgi:CRISPR-associated protein Cmx8